MLKHVFVWACLMGSAASAATCAEPCTLHLAGDSTLAWRRPDESSGSWGEALRADLRPSARIRNCAIAGRSTVTFRPQWETNLIGRVKKGDSCPYPVRTQRPLPFAEEARGPRGLRPVLHG